MRRWTEDIDATAGAELTLASGDASFRRYFRLQKAGESFIVMDAPPEREDCVPFIRVAGYLEAMGLNAPRVLKVDLEQGFLLLTDLGSTQYLERLENDDASADKLYGDAIAALATLQVNGTAYQASLPAFDREFLEFELSLFHDWLCEKHLQIQFSDADERAWSALSNLLIDNALGQPQVFVHRDYHSRNLMETKDNNPGILDFQDAMEGPLTYDLVSLLKDCYVKWPADRVLGWVDEYRTAAAAAGCDVVPHGDFLRYFELMGVQRHLKAAGIFARLNHRDGKPDYMLDVPRTLSYILDLVPRYDELAFLGRLVKERCLPGLEADA